MIAWDVEVLDRKSGEWLYLHSFFANDYRRAIDIANYHMRQRGVSSDSFRVKKSDGTVFKNAW